MANETTPRKPVQTTPKSTEKARRGRKPVADKAAPHGRDANGKPLAPHGYLDDGETPRLYPKRDASKLDLAMLAAPQEVTADLATALRPTRPRSDAQKVMDNVVREKHQEWVKAGRPTDWIDIPKGRYHLNPDAVADVKFLINKAGDFLKLRIRYGKPGIRDNAGNEVVVFGVMDRVKKEKETD